MTKKYRLVAPEKPAAAFTIDYRAALNDSQFDVVTTADGPCLVLAGAGSGKTRTLIYRVAYLLEKGVRPEEILLVTFTNKAAEEMKTRVEGLLQMHSKGLWCGTFHHIGNRSLRIYSKALGLGDHFSILDEEDSRDLVKHCVKTVTSSSGGLKFPKPAVVHSVLSFSANSQISITDVIARRYPYLAQFARDFEAIGTLYTEKKRKTNHLDYDDLLLKWIELLDKVPAAKERFTAQFRFCLVDEYQDTNRLQHEIIRRLAERHRNVLVVGDDAQSIYSFRAAQIQNILDFPDIYSDAKIFKLETNYRSTKAILNLANDSIRHNKRQFPKTLASARGSGETPQFVRVRDTGQEAGFVAQKILELRDSGYELSDIAILFRAHYQAAEVELEMAKRGIPYVIRGGIRFFEQAHVKDALSFLKIVANPSDELSWSRALMLQPGIGAGYADKIIDLADAEGDDLKKVCQPAFGSSLPAKVREGLHKFKQVLRPLLTDGVSDHPDTMLEEVLAQGYNKHVLMNFENAQDRLEDLRELINFAHTYKDLKEFLGDVTLREGFKGETLAEGSGEEEVYQPLLLSTIHQAKGLEWRAVFVIGLAEGLFPHAKSMDNEENLEEERRLFYVAVTRAKEELFLVHPMTRYDYQAGTVINRPSMFVEELRSDLYEDVEVEEDNPEERTIYLE